MKIFDSQFDHAVSAGSPYKDIQVPFQWERNFNTIRKDEFVFFTESEYHTSKTIDHDKKILWVLESPCFVNADVVKDLQKNWSSFHKILTHDDRLTHLPNAMEFPVGGCWIRDEDAKLHKKTKNISLVLSSKNLTYGQSLRHQIAGNNSVDTYGFNHAPLDQKIEALRDYKFHICIENFKNKKYFTEKIIDCFATGTIPIYWGSADIWLDFDERGIIQVDDYEELESAIKYAKNFEIEDGVIETNFNLSKQYWLPETRILSIFG